MPEFNLQKTRKKKIIDIQPQLSFDVMKSAVVDWLSHKSLVNFIMDIARKRKSDWSSSRSCTVKAQVESAQPISE